MNSLQRVAGSMLLFGLFTAAPRMAVSAEPAALLRNFSSEQLLVNTHVRCILISAYVAVNPEQRSQGLMFITELERHEGMIFRFSQAQRISMWMKNTVIPLDMLFLDTDGIVLEIAKETIPMSQAIIASKQMAAAVLELGGGVSDDLGISPGDRITGFADASR